MATRRPPAADPRAVTELARQLGTLLGELDLTEIEVGIGELRVRLQRQRQSPAPVAAPPLIAGPVGMPAVVPVVDVATSSTLVTIEAPMVGTFYRASSPTAEPFVREGDVIKEGQIICIIEAMKLMNEIESKASGRVVKILVENAQPVEYGQPLIQLEPAG